MDIKKDLETLLKRAVEKNGNFSLLLKETGLEISLESPKNKKFGDFSSSIALTVARKLNNPPLTIACKLQEALDKELNSSELCKKIDKIEVKEPGFINFFLNKAYLYEILLEIRKKGNNFGRVSLGKGEKVHIEFVSANPTGPLNAAHGRQAAFGDSLANLLQFSGYKVTREYYVNDQGTQIDILGESVRAKYLGILGIPAQFPASGYRGKYIDGLADELAQKYGRRFVETAPGRLAFFSRFACGKLLKEIKTALNAFGVQFDCWFSQKKLNKTGKITKVLKLLKKKGILYQKEGAWWLATSKFGDDKDRVAIKSDSKHTYITPDIAYHQTKFKRKFTRLLNIWGPDHHGYIGRLKAALSALGYDAKSLTILLVQLVTLAKAEKVIPMSTRLGQGITLQDIIQAVGKDAARFFFLMRKRDSHLHFDLELAKKQSLENPVYYIQYACARISNILKFAENTRPLLHPNLSLLNKTEELNLIQTLGQFPAVVQSCALNLEPHRITIYLQELAKDFHHYYEKYRIVTEDPGLTCARLVLIDAVRIVLNNGLRLLAVSAPEKM